jgi:hypothetical protein
LSSLLPPLLPRPLAAAAQNDALAEERSARWLSLDAGVRAAVKHDLVLSLSAAAPLARQSAAQAVAKVGKVEVPAKQWPELVDGLVSASLAEGVALTTKAASLTALGYLCEEVQDPDDIEQAARDKILAAIVNNCAPTAVLEVRRAAIKGLLHSLDFAECVATRRRRSGRPRRAAPLRRQAAAPPCRRAAVPPRPLFPPQGKLWRRARERARRHRQRGVRVHVRRERRRGAPGGV